MWELNDDLNIPEKLGQAGVKASAITPMSKAAMLSGNITINPRKTAQRDIEQIFKNAL